MKVATARHLKQAAVKLPLLTVDQWRAQAVERFGSDPMKWRFVCPSCGRITSVEDWRNSGAGEGEVAFSCVGRRLSASDKNTFSGNGKGCQYAGGGLFRLNPQPIEGHENVFAFAETVAEESVEC